MPIAQRNGRFQVRVERAKARPGFRRVSTTVDTYAEAAKVEEEIVEALTVYGKWPVEPGDRPLRNQTLDRAARGGTLRKAAEIAKDAVWGHRRYAKQGAGYADAVVRFMEGRGRYDIDTVLSEDLDAFIADCRAAGNSASTINAKLSALSVINDVALDRLPPLARVRLPIRRVPAEAKPRWWLRPEDQTKLLGWLHDQGDVLMADYVEWVVNTGLRVEETLRLQERHFSGLTGDRPSLTVPGTKTDEAEATIPISTDAAEIALRRIAAARVVRATHLFPIPYDRLRERWAECRAFLGYNEVPTATLKALRRSFARVANDKGVSTADLKRLLRHSTITTTDGYLNLVGGVDREAVRSKLNAKSDGPAPGGDLTLADLIEAINRVKKI